MTLGKADLRARVLAARRAMPSHARAAAAESLTRSILDLPELRSAAIVTAYLSIGTEPATAQLLNSLSLRRTRILLPVLLSDFDLDWAEYDEEADESPARMPPAPAGRPLGVEAVAQADVVIAPALAVDVHGTRLGRGGGSYDRALARVPATTPVVVAVYDGEVLPDVPAEAHDRPVSIAVTPSRTWRFP